MFLEDPKIQAAVSRIINGMTSDEQLRKELASEAVICLIKLKKKKPRAKRAWYLKSCKNCLLDYLRTGRSLDSHKRRHRGRSLDDAVGSNTEWPEALVAGN